MYDVDAATEKVAAQIQPHPNTREMNAIRDALRQAHAAGVAQYRIERITKAFTVVEVQKATDANGGCGIYDMG